MTTFPRHLPTELDNGSAEEVGEEEDPDPDFQDPAKIVPYA